MPPSGTLFRYVAAGAVIALVLTIVATKPTAAYDSKCAGGGSATAAGDSCSVHGEGDAVNECAIGT
jgi:hypothetical protein